MVEPNFSIQGIAVLADTLEAGGGAIRAATTEADADLWHDGLDHDPAHKVDWRPALTVADARVTEGAGATVEFEVRLGRAASQTVTVNYATGDGSARAGEDYTAASGTLRFETGESSKTIASGCSTTRTTRERRRSRWCCRTPPGRGWRTPRRPARSRTRT